MDPTLWRLEQERLAPQLRITVAADARDWRGHLEAARTAGQAVDGGWGEARPRLERLCADVSSSLDKLDTREGYLNVQLHTLLVQYQAARQQAGVVQVGAAGRPAWLACLAGDAASSASSATADHQCLATAWCACVLQILAGFTPRLSTTFALSIECIRSRAAHMHARMLPWHVCSELHAASDACPRACCWPPGGAGAAR